MRTGVSFWGSGFLRKYVSAPFLRNASLFVRHAPRDVLDQLMGNTQPLVPPRRKVFVGEGDFRKCGDEYFGYFVKHGEIKPHFRVLDIGSGIGRMSRPFASFLDPGRGRFEGFDIDEGGVEWCQRHYAQFPHFRFQRVNIYNKFYNPRGKIQAEDFIFPYADASFDFAFATSIFTHLRFPVIAHYIKELDRVLAPGARAVLTVYLWNDEVKSLVAQGKSQARFVEYGDLIVLDPNIPERMIAVRQSDWDTALSSTRLVVRKVVQGNWCGTNSPSLQDLIVVEKPA